MFCWCFVLRDLPVMGYYKVTMAMRTVLLDRLRTTMCAGQCIRMSFCAGTLGRRHAPRWHAGDLLGSVPPGGAAVVDCEDDVRLRPP